MSGDQLQPEDTLDDRGVKDVLDEGYSPPEHERHRIPEGEETLADRLAQEEPEVWADEPAVEGNSEASEDEGIRSEAGDLRTGRLMADGGEGRPDVDNRMWAEDEGIDGAGASAEEAAMHTIDESGLGDLVDKVPE